VENICLIRYISDIEGLLLRYVGSFGMLIFNTKGKPCPLRSEAREFLIKHPYIFDKFRRENGLKGFI